MTRPPVHNPPRAGEGSTAAPPAGLTRKRTTRQALAAILAAFPGAVLLCWRCGWPALPGRGLCFMCAPRPRRRRE